MFVVIIALLFLLMCPGAISALVAIAFVGVPLMVLIAAIMSMF